MCFITFAKRPHKQQWKGILTAILIWRPIFNTLIVTAKKRPRADRARSARGVERAERARGERAKRASTREARLASSAPKARARC
jgi:hypothetical protein